MADKSYRIRVGVGSGENVVSQRLDKKISLQLRQGVMPISILSLEINPEDNYKVDTSGYGVIVGRVLANGSYGIPNVKVSVFVPLSTEDEADYVTSNEYPYATTMTKDMYGNRYNLVTKDYGSFPGKREVLDNEGVSEVYERYWQYTTTTNESGDYMIFGVPTGTCQVHYDCDLSDIGMVSQKPYDMIANGYSPNLFKSKTEFVYDNMTSAVHILSQDKTVYVYPFWGDDDRNIIGITRNDIEIDYKFNPSCIFMGSSITDSKGTSVGVDGRPSGKNGDFMNLTTSGGDIEVIRQRQDGTIEELTENVKGIIDGNGTWCYQIPMNLDRISTDEYGNLVAENDPDKGIPTRARIRVRISLSDAMDESNGEYTGKILIPNNPPLKAVKISSSASGADGVDIDFKEEPYDEGEGITQEEWERYYEFGSLTPDCCFADVYWDKVYSVKQYLPRFMAYDEEHEMNLDEIRAMYDKLGGYVDYNNMPPVLSNKLRCKVGYLITIPINDYYHSTINNSPSLYINGIDDGIQNPFPYNTLYCGSEYQDEDRSTKDVVRWMANNMTNEMNSGYRNSGIFLCFENDWINGCLYFPRFVITRKYGKLDYYGAKNDDSSSTDRYYNRFIFGRHRYRFDAEDRFDVEGFDTNIKDKYSIEGDQYIYNPIVGYNKVYYSRLYRRDCNYYTSKVKVKSGFITDRPNRIGEDIFYYRNGDRQVESSVLGTHSYIRMYATDFILLGNLNDRYDSLPKLFEKLPSTSCTIPPLATPLSLSEASANMTSGQKQLYTMKKEDTDRTVVDIYGNDLENEFSFSEDAGPGIINGYDSSEHSMALYKATASENNVNTVDLNENGIAKAPTDNIKHFLISLELKTSLFFRLVTKGVPDAVGYLAKAFVNSSRICELGVRNDTSQLTENTGVYNGDNILNTVSPINGIIDFNDIFDSDSRSAFASMNYNINRSVYDRTTGRKRYTPTPIYVNNFDGRLKSYVDSENLRTFVNEVEDFSYTDFRYGLNHNQNPDEAPLMYSFDANNIIDETSTGENINPDILDPLLITQNSFYFYFGLVNGFTAIDKLRENYCDNVGKEKTGTVVNLTCEQIDRYFGCSGNAQLGAYKFTVENMKTPVTIDLYMKDKIYSTQEIDDLSQPIEEYGLPVGTYKAVATNADGSQYSTVYFSVYERTLALDGRSYVYKNSRILTIDTVNGGSVDSITVDGDTSVCTVSSYETNYTVRFDTPYVRYDASNRTFIFSGGTTSVTATVYREGTTCFSGTKKYSFEETYDDSKTYINGIPTELFSTEVVSASTPSEIERILWKGIRYVDFDGMNMIRAHIVDNTTYDTSKLWDYPMSEQLAMVSNMFNMVFCGGSIYGTTDNSSIWTPTLIYPSIEFVDARTKETAGYAWNNGESGPSPTHGVSVNAPSVPHRRLPTYVGSNYPIMEEEKSPIRLSRLLQRVGRNLEGKRLTVLQAMSDDMYGKALIYEGDNIIIADENKYVDYSYTVGTTTYPNRVHGIKVSGLYTYRGIKNAAIYTISDTSCADVVDAASRVPESYRKGKLFVRFHNVAPSRWETWLNTSSSWTTTESQWVLVGIGEGELDSTVSHGIYLKYAMSSIFDDFTGGGADVVLDESMRPGYVENRALRAIIEPRGGMFIGYDCVGFKNSVSSEYDIASALTPSFGSEYIAYDTETIGSMTGYIGFGTVDKRLDYVMSVLTPVTLCSGYDSFTSLKTKAISSGIASLDIYGGVRLCHDSGMTQTMYDTQGSEIRWSSAIEASTMTLSSYYIGEDDNGEALPVIESGKCVNWDNSDTDRVSYRTGNLRGGNHFSFSFTSYSGDFSDGTLRSGEVLSRSVLYSPGITLIHTPNTDMDGTYDIEYTNTDSDNPKKYNAHLSTLSSLKFTLATDDLYNGRTYTEVNTSGSTEERIITAGMSLRGVFGNKKTKSLSILVMSGDTLSDVSEEISLDMELPAGYSFNPSEYDFIRKDGVAVDDGELASSGLTFSVNAPLTGITLGDNDYLIIPTMKLYMEEANSLMAEGYVLKLGNAYYASSINVESSFRKLSERRPGQLLPMEGPELLEPEETWQYTITLTSPLREGKYIPYEGIESLVSGSSAHTIGEMEYYYVKRSEGHNDVNDVTVTYDQRSASFYVTRSLSEGFYLYFKFRNGLKYRINVIGGLA